jgi:hypothetical protein
MFMLVAAAAIGNAKDVANDFDPNAAFARYKTYAFVAGYELEKSGILEDPVRRERIKNFIAGGLEECQLREVPVDEPHTLAVRYWVARRNKQDIQTTSVSWSPALWGGYPPYLYGPWGFYYEEHVVRNYVDGTLIVDLIDTETKELVWRTYLRQKIEDRAKAYEEAKKKIHKAFSEFPPSAAECEKKRKEREKYPSNL